MTHAFLEWLHVCLAVIAVGADIVGAMSGFRSLGDLRGRSIYPIAESISIVARFIRYSLLIDKEFIRPNDGKGWGLAYYLAYASTFLCVLFGLLNFHHIFTFSGEQIPDIKNIGWRLGHIVCAFVAIGLHCLVLAADKNTPEVLD